MSTRLDENTQQLDAHVMVRDGDQWFTITRDLVTRAEYFEWLERTKQKPAPTVILRGAPRDPVLGVSPADARRYAEYFHMRLPTEREWALAATGAGSHVGLSDYGLRGLCRVWEWTSTPFKRGFVVRGGRYRDRLGEPASIEHRSWEDAGAHDVGFRLACDVDRTPRLT